MPELAEVEFFRRRWDGGLRSRIIRVDLHPHARIFRGADTGAIVDSLTGARLLESLAHGKQMIFSFSGGSWLGLHLGMTGELRVEPPTFVAGRHDHLVLRQGRRSLVFSDPRLFGRVRFDHSIGQPPDWWRRLPPAVISREFSRAHLARILGRRARALLKAVLLDQSAFPGVGNWMADEILWRARLHPLEPAGGLDARQLARLWRATRHVARTALAIIGPDWGDLPDSWLFSRRWSAGSRCPRCRGPLTRARAAGRTSCWCPACQPARPKRAVAPPVATGRRRPRPDR